MCIKEDNWCANILPVAQHATRKLIRQRRKTTTTLFVAQFFNQRPKTFFLSLQLNTSIVSFTFLNASRTMDNNRGSEKRRDEARERKKGSKMCHRAANDVKCEKGWTRSERSKNQQLQLLLASLLSSTCFYSFFFCFRCRFADFALLAIRK